MTLVGYDIDGVVTAGVVPEGDAVIISGRTFQEYDNYARHLATCYPVYIRGTGVYRDHDHAGRFKATMIRLLGVTTYYEDEPTQAALIAELCGDTCQVIAVPR